jgi:hypothetical protein
MADTVNTHWIYPPNWDTNPVDIGGNIPGFHRFKIRITNLSDGTGETDKQKLDISELRTIKTDQCTKTIIDKVYGIVSGLNVLLEWDRAPHQEICRLLGANGSTEVCIKGPIVDPSDGIGDGTGDILLTTTGHTSGDGYDITIEGRIG